MAACSSPCHQQHSVLACTAEPKSLVSVISKHTIMLVMCLTETFSAGAHWQVQTSTESCIYSLQRGPLLQCQLCCPHIGHSVTKYRASFSSVLSLGPVVFHGTFGTKIAMVPFVHKATMQFSLCEIYQICQFKTRVGQVSFVAPLLRVDRPRTSSLCVSFRPMTAVPPSSSCAWRGRGRRVNSGVDCHPR